MDRRSVADDIRQCKSTQQALLVLGEALDNIFVRLDELQPADEWDEDEWDEHDALRIVPDQPAMAVNHDDDEVVFREPPLELKTKRWAYAHDTLRLQDALKLDGDEACDAYAIGGPLWLWVYDRDFVMQLPRGYRQTMVQDVEDFGDLQGATDLATDILKFTPGESPKAVPQ